MTTSYRGYSWENIQYLPAPTGGWNTDDNPWSMNGTQAPVLDNFIIRTGNIQGRGPIKVVANLDSQFGTMIPGVARRPFGFIPTQYLGISYIKTPGVLPWDAPMAGSTSGVLAVPMSGSTGGGSVYYVSPTGQVVSNSPSTSDLVAGPRWINFNGTLYGLGFYSDSAAIQDKGASYFIKPSQMLKHTATAGVSNASQLSSSSSQAFNIHQTNTVPWSATLAGSPAAGEATLTCAEFSSGLFVTDAEAVTGWGFSIPTGATITGVSMNLTESFTSGVSSPEEVGIYLIDATGTLLGTNRADFTTWTPHRTRLVGGNGDLWGNASLTPAQVNAAEFGVVIACQFRVNDTIGENISVQIANFTIYYTLAGVAPAVPTVVTGAPKGSIDIAGYQSRIWVLAGQDVASGFTYHEPATLYCTIAGGIVNNTTADWINPATGAPYKFQIDNNNSDPGMGLGVVNNTLVIFRKNSVWRFTGTADSPTISVISKSVGCVDPRSIIEVDNGIYFIAQEGLMFTDGVSIKNASGSVMLSLQSAVLAEQAAVLAGSQGTGWGGWVSCGMTTQGQIVVSVGTYPPNCNQYGYPLWMGMMDPNLPGMPWTRITSNMVAAWSSPSSQNPLGLPGLFTTNRLVAQHSLHFMSGNTLFMLEDQSLGYTFLVAQGLFEDSTMVGTAPAQYYAIPFTWLTRTMPTIGTTSLARKYGQPTRFFLDHSFSVTSMNNMKYSTANGTFVLFERAWQVTPRDAYNNLLTTRSILNTMPTTTDTNLLNTTGASPPGFVMLNAPATYMQRDNIDFNHEIDDCSLLVSFAPNIDPEGNVGQVYADGLDVGAVNAIYGLGIEFATIRNLRTKV